MPDWPEGPSRWLVALVGSTVLLGGCGEDAPRPEPGCASHGGVVKTEPRENQDGVQSDTFYVCKDGTVGQLDGSDA